MDVKPRMIRVSLAVALAATTAWYVTGESCTAQHHHSAPGGNPRPAAAAPQSRPAPRPAVQPQPVAQDPLEANRKRLLATQEAVARAIGHLEAGRQQDALRELKLVQGALESLRQSMERNTASSFVNERCPILGAPVDPAKTPAALTRLYEGHRVAFCCAGCPQKWDQLPNAEKSAKLANVTTRPQ